jgi:hypothetical protein
MIGTLMTERQAAVHFLDVLKGNRSKWASAIGGGVLVFVIWQIGVALAVLLPAFLDPTKFQAPD